MGIVSLPRAPVYWEGRWHQPFVVDASSRNRFQEMLRFFHIAPPTPAGVKHTVLDKVAPLITACQHSFSSCFLPAQVLVVDESMVPFKGREPMKQYLPDKPTSWGYKGAGLSGCTAARAPGAARALAEVDGQVSKVEYLRTLASVYKDELLSTEADLRTPRPLSQSILISEVITGRLPVSHAASYAIH